MPEVAPPNRRTRRRAAAAMLVVATVAPLGVVAATTTPASAATSSGVAQAAQPPEATIGQAYSYQLQDTAGSPATSAEVPPTYGSAYDDAPCPSPGYVGGLPSGLSLSPTGLITGTPEFPEQTQFCDYLYFADGSSGDSIITLTVETGNATLDPTIIPDVSQTVSLLQAGLQTVQGLAGFVEGQPACVEYYAKVVEALLGEPGYVGGPPYSCLVI